VGLDVRFSTLCLPSRFAHPLTRVGPQQQQQQPQQQSIELEKVMRIVFQSSTSKTLEPPQALGAGVEQFRSACG
jgi:hypothetical protein